MSVFENFVKLVAVYKTPTDHKITIEYEGLKDCTRFTVRLPFGLSEKDGALEIEFVKCTKLLVHVNFVAPDYFDKYAIGGTVYFAIDHEEHLEIIKGQIQMFLEEASKERGVKGAFARALLEEFFKEPSK